MRQAQAAPPTLSCRQQREIDFFDALTMVVARHTLDGLEALMHRLESLS